jgi:hypothetical protein
MQDNPDKETSMDEVQREYKRIQENKKIPDGIFDIFLFT